VLNPAWIARCASSGRTTPLSATGPFHSEHSHAASSQSKAYTGGRAVKGLYRRGRERLAFVPVKAYKHVPGGKRNLERGHFSQSNCISPESPGRRLIEDIELSFRLERAYT
jgi:hypothetical protein